MATMREHWRLIVSVEERPTVQENDLELEHLFSVTLRDAGEIALIDGKTYEFVSIIPTGYAVHISRLSATGRHLQVIGRDGLVTLIDLWMDPPAPVAELEIGIEARSAESSKATGWEDTYAIADGMRLEPLKLVPTRGYTVDEQEFHPEPRVASHDRPEFVVNVKETSKILVVNYEGLANLQINESEAARFLHDGGWDAAGRYVLVAANAVHKIAVVDTVEGRLAALVDSRDQTPHPGRGANFRLSRVRPGLGDDASRRLDGLADRHRSRGSPRASLGGGADAGGPRRRLAVPQDPSQLGQPLRRLPAQSRCEHASTVAVFDLESLEAGYEELPIGEWSGITEGIRRIVQPEYNRDGTEVWFSVWNAQDEESAIVIVDDETRTLKPAIRHPRLVTPTGKFNVSNTQNDIY